MKDIVIDTDNKLIFRNYALRFSSTTAEYVVQKLRIELRTFLGEWYLDTSKGMPYFERVFVKNPDFSLLDAIFKRKILSNPYVGELTFFEMSYDTELRKTLMTFRVKVIGTEEETELIEVAA